MTITQKLPVWLNGGVEPPEEFKSTGWLPGEKPPAQYMNWLFNRIYECLLELQSNASTGDIEQRLIDIEELIGPFDTIATPEIANITAAIAALRTQLTTHLADDALHNVPVKKIKTGKDANGIFTTVEHRRKSDDTLIRKAVLSGGTSPQYTTRTVTYYGKDGATIVEEDVFTISYDADGNWISEV